MSRERDNDPDRDHAAGQRMNTPAVPASSLSGLLATWQACNDTDTLRRALRRARSQGDEAAAGAVRHVLAGQARVDPLDAIAANHELAAVLPRGRWLAVRAARHAGASWERIGDAAGGLTADQARADYLAELWLSDRAAYHAELNQHTGEDTGEDSTDAGLEGSVSVVVQLADALDRLSARVQRDCDVEASEGVPPREPAWAQVVEDLAAYAEQCREVLDAPEVTVALDDDPDWIAQPLRRRAGPS